MKWLKRLLLGAVLLVAVSIGGRWAYVASVQAGEIREFQDQVELARRRLAHADSDTAEIKTRWAALQKTLAAISAQAEADSTILSEIRKRFGRVKQLKDLIAQHPTLSLPEIQLLDADAWLDVANQGSRFDAPEEVRGAETAEQLRSALFDLRLRARMAFADKIQEALRRYLDENQGVLPTRIDDLNPYFEQTPDPAILERYQLLHAGRLDALPHEPPLSASSDYYSLLFSAHGSASGRTGGLSPEKETPAVVGEKDDLLFAGESRLQLGRDSFAIKDEFDWKFPSLGTAVNRAEQRWMATQPSQWPPTLAKIMPFFDPPLDAPTRLRLEQFDADRRRRKSEYPFPDLKP